MPPAGPDAILMPSAQEADDMDFWDFFWLIAWSFFLVCYITILFQIVVDLFRDQDLSGWWKAVWIIALLFFPLLTALVYIIVRARSMTERQAVRTRRTRAATDSYITPVTGRGNPAEQIADAKALLDEGAITNEEFQRLKAKALA